MISCLLSKSDECKIQKMLLCRDKLLAAVKRDPLGEAQYLKYRNAIVVFVLDRLGPALRARIKTWTVRHYCEDAEAESFVYEHVLMAVDKYKLGRGNCKFSSFLWTLSNRAFANHISATRRQKRDPRPHPPGENMFAPQSNDHSQRYIVSLDETVSVSDGSGVPLVLGDVIPDTKHIEDALAIELLLKFIHKKCDPDQKILLSLMQQNYTYKEIAALMNTDAGTISRQIQQLRKKLKHELNCRDFSKV